MPHFLSDHPRVQEMKALEDRIVERVKKALMGEPPDEPKIAEELPEPDLTIEGKTPDDARWLGDGNA